MIATLPATGRFHTRIGWLDSWHTFSFGEHYDPERMGFRALRVINDDIVAPGNGFGMHGHRDMEILTWVLSGKLEHRDSLGSGSVLDHGLAQRMSAGTGIRHSETNPSSTEPVHLLQIWLEPDRAGHEPSYEEKRFDIDAAPDRWHLIAAPGGADGALTIHQDATMRVAALRPGVRLTHAVDPARYAWVHVARGAVSINGGAAAAGDGVAIAGEMVDIVAESASEVVLFDLA